MLAQQPIRIGILYIAWILIAWSMVGLLRLYWLSQTPAMLPITKTIVNELMRIFVFIVPIMIFVMRHWKKPWYRWLGLYGCKKRTMIKTIITAIVYGLVCYGVNIYGFNKTPHLSAIPCFFWFTSFSLSIIMEEIAFRGFLFYAFESLNKNAAVLITSLAFAAKHIPGWLIFPAEISSSGFIGDFATVFGVGCILGYLYLATHSVWATSAVHSVNNLVVALFN